MAAFEQGVLARFHRRHWRPEGAVIAVSGDIDAGQLVARLDELFGGWDAAGEERSQPGGGFPADEED